MNLPVSGFRGPLPTISDDALHHPVGRALHDLQGGLKRGELDCDAREAAKRVRSHTEQLGWRLSCAGLDYRIEAMAECEQARLLATRLENFIAPCVNNGGMLDPTERSQLETVLLQLVDTLNVIHEA